MVPIEFRGYRLLHLVYKQTQRQKQKVLIDSKRLAKYLYPGHTRAIMMNPLFNNTQRDHHEYEPIEKREQPPALV